MSKNTGTSELINYFDLGANGDVGIAGSLDVNTIANATTDTDKFLVSDTGIIKYRTGAELLSDIGAAPATGGSYLPLAGGTLTGTTRMDGSGGTTPAITMIFNSGINRLLAPLLRLYGATNESSNYIELYGTLATSNRTINFPDASGTVALTSQIPANPVGGTGTSGTIPVFTGSTTIGNSIIQSNSTQVNIVGNGSSLLFDSLGASKTGGIQYTNDFELLVYNSRGTGSAIYLGNTNLDFNTNVSGNPRIRITSGGNVLINTTTDAGFKLDVNGTGRFSGNVEFASIIYTDTVQNYTGGTTPLRIKTGGAQSLILQTNSTDRLTISSTGAATFSSSVSGTSLRSSAVGTFGFNTANNGEFQIYATAESGLVMAGRGFSFDMVITNKNGADTIRIPTGTTNVNFVGAVLIGTTTNPYGIGSLVVSHNSTLNRTYFQRGVELIEIVPSDGTAPNLISSSYTSSGSAYKPLAFSARQNSADLYLTTSGNVLIGTTSDSGYKLYVNGASFLNGYNYASSIQYTRPVSNSVNPAGGEGVLIFSGGQSAIRMNSNYTMNFDMYNGGNQFTALQIRQNGNAVSVNSPDNQLSLEISYQGVGQGYLGATASYGRSLLAYSQNGGYVYLSSSSTWVNASDRNRKKNFETYNKGLAEICNLKPTLFNLKNQSDDEPKIAGLIAQEVGEHIKEAFSDGEFIGIDYSVLTVTIINAIKELNEKINKLS